MPTYRNPRPTPRRGLMLLLAMLVLALPCAVHAQTVESAVAPAPEIRLDGWHPIVLPDRQFQARWFAGFDPRDGVLDLDLLVEAPRGWEAGWWAVRLPVEAFIDFPGPGDWTSDRWILDQANGRFIFNVRQLRPQLAGDLVYTPDGAFRDHVTARFGGVASPEQWLGLALFDIDQTWIDLGQAATNPPATLDELIAMRAAGVPESELRRMVDLGRRLPVRELIGDPRGAAPPLPVYSIPAPDLIRLQTMGVDSSYFPFYEGAGGPFSVSDLVRLRGAGVTPDYIGAALWAGMDYSVSDLIRLRTSGVPAEFLSAASWSGRSFSASELTRLRAAGVPPEYLSVVGSLGYSTSDLIRLHSAGVPADYLLAASQGNERWSASDLIRMWSSRVTTRMLEAAGWSPQVYSASDLIRLQSAGVPPELVEAAGWSGEGFSVTDMIRLAGSGITAAYLRGLYWTGQGYGFTVVQIIERRRDGRFPREFRPAPPTPGRPRPERATPGRVIRIVRPGDRPPVRPPERPADRRPDRPEDRRPEPGLPPGRGVTGTPPRNDDVRRPDEVRWPDEVRRPETPAQRESATPAPTPQRDNEAGRPTRVPSGRDTQPRRNDDGGIDAR